MNEIAFRPILYFKKNCPFCLKVRIFALEAGLLEAIDIREFTPGADSEVLIRDALRSALDKVTFPAAQIDHERFVANSDAIVSHLAKLAGRQPEELPLYNAYLASALEPMIVLHRENAALKDTNSRLLASGK